MPDNTPRYSIAEIADLGGVSRRTVRYYTQRELIPAPLGLGRGKHYTRAHLDALIEIRQWQEHGDSLATIARRLAERAGVRNPASQVAQEDSNLAPDPEPMTLGLWMRMPLAEGIELHLRAPPELPVRDLPALQKHLQESLESFLDRRQQGG